MNRKRKGQDSLDLLFALIKSGRKSDRELAKVLGVSQPTVTRKRTDLEKEGMILGYTVIPNMVKMGYDFLAFTFLSFSDSSPELFDRAREWIKSQPCVLYAVNGEGLAKDSCMISAHKDYGSYSKLITELRRDWRPNLKDAESFFISLGRPELVVKPFSFHYLEKNK